MHFIFNVKRYDTLFRLNAFLGLQKHILAFKRGEVKIKEDSHTNEKQGVIIVCNNLLIHT